MLKRFGLLILVCPLVLFSHADVEQSTLSIPEASIQEAPAQDESKQTPPYDEAADAEIAITTALAGAKAANKLLLITFGANWCPDCRALDRAIKAPAIREVLAKHFVSVKVDVGDWDKNLPLIARWGKPTSGGIPTVVVATPEREILYTTRAGQLSKARDMGLEAFAEFFAYIASFKP